ncbi:hypothetical protein GOODEAATRI_013503 [Goodea atripinnis]|uniref:Uncharacterized protein n=1 Tax=Goodea atripinnis TaxID=208336 RepID=A0ABV0PY96_9TELE
MQGSELDVSASLVYVHTQVQHQKTKGLLLPSDSHLVHWFGPEYISCHWRCLESQVRANGDITISGALEWTESRLKSKMLTTSSQPCIAGLRTDKIIMLCSVIVSSFHRMNLLIQGCITCRVQRCSTCITLSPPNVRCSMKQVLHDQRMALPAGNVEGVPPILVSQRGVCAVGQQLLDHIKVLSSARHHERSPMREDRNLL